MLSCRNAKDNDQIRFINDASISHCYIQHISRLNNEYRVIWLDGRDREPEDSRDNNWNGESIDIGKEIHWLLKQLDLPMKPSNTTKGIFTGDQLKIIERISMHNDGHTLKIDFTMTDPEHWVGEWKHTKFRDRALRADVREANCFAADNALLPECKKEQ